MDQTITKYTPPRGNCFGYKLPTELLRKLCLLNVIGPEALTGGCFRFAVLAAFHTAKNMSGEYLGLSYIHIGQRYHLRE